MTVPVQEQLHAFATTLLERRGALVEWPAADRAGTAMLPPEVAAAVGTADDVVPAGVRSGRRRAFRQSGGRLPGMGRPAARRRAQRRCRSASATCTSNARSWTKASAGRSPG